MAESDPVKRLKAAARRAAGPVAVETQHRWYMEELEQTIGRDPSASAWQKVEDREGPRWLGPLFLLAIVGAISFAATAAVLLWQDGTLSRFFVERQIIPNKKTPRWILGDQETGRPSAVPTGKAAKSDAPPNEIEPLIQPPAPPPSSPATDEDGAAE